MRDLLLASIVAGPTEAGQDLIHPGDDLFFRRPGRQGYGHVIESSLHVEGGGKSLISHPEDAKPTVVGSELGSAANFVHVFGRQRNANNDQTLPASVKDSADRIPDL